MVHRKIWTEIKAAETKAEAALYYNTTSLLAIVPIHDSAANNMKWEVGARPAEKHMRSPPEEPHLA